MANSAAGGASDYKAVAETDRGVAEAGRRVP